MNVRILQPEEYARWDKFAEKHPLGTIHQDSSWGEFQAKIPYRGKFWIVVLEKDGEIVGGSLIVRHALPKGMCWLYAARGPLLDYETPDFKPEIVKLAKALKKIAAQENAIFLRIDPPLVEEEFELPPKISRFHKIPHGFQPHSTLILDISVPETAILAQMKQKGRYNIKVAQKRGVEVIRASLDQPEVFDEQITKFHEIFSETTTRDGFSGHNKDYYKSMVETLAPNYHAALYLAKYEGQIISGLIATYHGETATYYFGASSNAHRNVMAPYLLQWTAIQDAKAAGYKYYDFLGIAKDEDNKKDSWYGITQFKRKFGGQKVDYIGAQEFAFKPLLYWLYRSYKKLR